jgi:hypothetical protein
MSLAKSSLDKLGIKYAVTTGLHWCSYVQCRALKIQVHIVKICHFQGKANVTN